MKTVTDSFEKDFVIGCLLLLAILLGAWALEDRDESDDEVIHIKPENVMIEKTEWYRAGDIR